MPKRTKQKFDAAQSVTDDLIRVIERGVLPWRQPWRGPASQTPLRHNGEAYQGVNTFLLTLQTALNGYSSPYWMTFQQAKDMDAQVRKGEKSSIVVYYGTAEKKTDDGVKDGNVYRFLKSYRVFNADQIEGLDDTYHPAEEDVTTHPPCEPIPHMQEFFNAIAHDVSFTGREAYYMQARDKIYIPPIDLFEDPRKFYSVWCHELGHWTKPLHRLNRDYGDARFGNTAYAREEIVAELTAMMVGQKLGFTAHTLEMNAAYIQNWVTVLRSDKTAIFKHAADAQKACDFLIEASRKGRTTHESMAVPMAA